MPAMLSQVSRASSALLCCRCDHSADPSVSHYSLPYVIARSRCLFSVSPPPWLTCDLYIKTDPISWENGSPSSSPAAAVSASPAMAAMSEPLPGPDELPIACKSRVFRLIRAGRSVSSLRYLLPDSLDFLFCLSWSRG